MVANVHHVSLLTPRVAPLNSRGAEVAAQLFAALCRFVGQAFSRSTRVTASAVATAHRAEEARSVRQLASQMERSDPGFAADLRAAAARHEA